MLTAAIVVLGLAALAPLAMRLGVRLVYRVWDRSLRAERHHLTKDYEIPRYYRRGPGGAVDYSARWPGKDGYYFLFFPDDGGLPLKIIRASVETGLYGLPGLDRRSRGEAPDPALYLALIPTAERTNLIQRYVPRQSHLRMSTSDLRVTMSERGSEVGATPVVYATISGRWPEYRLTFSQPEAGIRGDLRLQARDVLFWADVPGVFTYFACFGPFEGTIELHRGTAERRAVRGRGTFEHGFARRWIDPDRAYRPIRWIQRLIPTFRPLRYHYEILMGDGAHHGGFLKARAFGVDVRDHGGLYVDGRHVAIRGVKITYHDDPAPDVVAPRGPGRAPVVFYRRWTVEANTDAGPLRYTAEREGPLPLVASNLAYYHFRYQGSCGGVPIRGRGYGEYAHI